MKNEATDHILEAIEMEIDGKKILAVKTAMLDVPIMVQGIRGNGAPESYCYLKRGEHEFALLLNENWRGFRGREITYQDLDRVAEAAFGAVSIRNAMDVLDVGYDRIQDLIKSGQLETCHNSEGAVQILSSSLWDYYDDLIRLGKSMEPDSRIPPPPVFKNREMGRLKSEAHKIIPLSVLIQNSARKQDKIGPTGLEPAQPEKKEGGKTNGAHLYSLYCDAFIRESDEYKRACTADPGGSEAKERAKRLIYYGIKMVTKEPRQINLMSPVGRMEIFYLIEGLMSRLTPNELVTIFPVDKEYDGEKRGLKDYFFTMEALRNIGMDTAIGSHIDDLLCDYQNMNIRMFNALKFGAASDISAMCGKTWTFDEWVAMGGLKGYPSGTTPLRGTGREGAGKLYLLEGFKK